MASPAFAAVASRRWCFRLPSAGLEESGGVVCVSCACRVRVVCGRLWVEASENAFYRIFYFFILLLNVLVSFLTARTPTRVSPLVAYLPTT